MAGGGMVSSLREMVRKYGRVAVGVHLSVSGLCFSGCYLAILNSFDVEGILEKVGLGSWIPAPEKAEAPPALPVPDHGVPDASHRSTTSGTPSWSIVGSTPQQNSTTDGEGGGSKGGNWSITKGGGAFALAWICNKALFPVRVPITIGLTPTIHRFLTSRGFRV